MSNFLKAQARSPEKYEQKKAVKQYGKLVSQYGELLASGSLPSNLQNPFQLGQKTQGSSKTKGKKGGKYKTPEEARKAFDVVVERLEDKYRRGTFEGKGKKKKLVMRPYYAIQTYETEFEQEKFSKKKIPKIKEIKKYAEAKAELERRRAKVPSIVTGAFGWIDSKLPSREEVDKKLKKLPSKISVPIFAAYKKDKKTGMIESYAVPAIKRKTIIKGVRGVETAYEYAKAGAKKVVETVEKLPSPTYVAKKVIMYKQGPTATAIQKPLYAGVRNISKALFMTPLTEQRGRGRPRGPSGRYRVEGRPVYEDAYQQYLTKQRALNRISPSTSQQAPITQEYIQQQLDAQAQQQMEQQMQTPEDVPMDETQMPVEDKQPMRTQQAPSPALYSGEREYFKQRQMEEQEEDNILKAPNFSKGELKATGGSILTATGPQILDAPQFAKGEMRTLRKNRGDPYDEGEVKIGERPQTNPYGDEYLDIELGSGKPVLKRRPREKWMTGEAL